ncbi:hypothetical protein CAAN1_09S00518 [[Candida] anglica]|uniref:F-box domain-containing protein n=1 Tax=[Candida] anglica TaxID=148631 RepID=A0ABP0EC17_9ASCO
MKKYQLIGRRKALSSQSSKEIRYPAAHLHSLPFEILLEVLQHLTDDINNLLSMALVCHKFNSIINKAFLYNTVTLNGSRKFSKFAISHIPTVRSLAKKFSSQVEASSKVNLIQTLILINPPTKETQQSKTKIAGTYDIESMSRRGQDTEYDSYVTSLTNFCKESYSLKNLILSELPPQFAFPIDSDEGSSNSSGSNGGLFSSWKREKPKRTLSTLVLKAQSGWSMPFKYSHISTIISVYDQINELILQNFIVDEGRLSSYQTTQNIEIETLTLKSCAYTNRPTKRVPSFIFKNVNHLKLLNVSSVKDLSVIDFVKSNNNLNKLTIDFNSSVFYESTPNFERAFNFTRFNSFFKLLCSGSGSYSNLNEIELVNFSLWDEHGHRHNIDEVSKDSDQDDWVAPSTDTFETLLSYLSNIPSLRIMLKDRTMETSCIKCGAIQSPGILETLGYCSWERLLSPVIKANEKCKIRLLSFSGNVLFVRDTTAPIK